MLRQRWSRLRNAAPGCHGETETVSAAARGGGAGVQPVFLVGALRSGTTMARLMLNQHPEICWFGEFDYAVDRVSDDGTPPGTEEYLDWLDTHRIFRVSGFHADRSLDYASLVSSFLAQARRRSGKRFVGATIHRHFRRIRAIWPGARIIHIVRDPRDVAQSWVKLNWAGSVWVAAAQWLRVEQEWDRFMPMLSRGQYLEVRYEDLVRRPPAVLASMCGFIGVDFDPAMLSYDETSTYAAPDASMLGRWRETLTHRQVRLIEGRTGPLLEKRGYAPSGLPPLEPGHLSRTWMNAHSRLTRVHARMRHYGSGLWLREWLLRKLEGRARWRRVRVAMNEIDQARLK